MTDNNPLSAWGIKRFKHFASLSEDSNAWAGELTFNGKVVGNASNGGYGGSACSHLNAENRNLDLPRGLDDHLDLLAEDLINDQITKKSIKALRKHLDAGRYLFIRPDEMKAWEAGTDHRESDAPPYRVCSLLSGVTQGSILFGKGDEEALEAFVWKTDREERARHKARIAEWLAAAQKEGDLRRAREAREEAKKAKKA